MSLPIFFEELRSNTVENPIGDGRVFRRESLLDVRPQNGKAIIQWVQALETKKGAGTRAMQFITELADKHGVDLMLFVEPLDAKGAIKKRALTNFYKKFGFITKDGMMHRKAQNTARLSAYADSIADLIATTSVDAKVKAAVEEAAFYIALSAMTYDQAKTVLGFSLSDSPSPSDIKRAWQKLAMKYHPDRGGDPEMMVEVNVAKDILDGTRKPDKTTGPTTKSSSPAPSAAPPSYSWKPKNDPSVTLASAAHASGADKIAWLGFFTQRHTGYSGDETSLWNKYYVAVGMHRDLTKVHIGLFTKTERDSGINGGQSVVWSVQLGEVKKKSKDVLQGVKEMYRDHANFVGVVTRPMAQVSKFSTTVGKDLIPILEKGVTVPVVNGEDLLTALGLNIPAERAAKPKKASVSLHYDRGDDGVMRGGFSLNGGEVHRVTDAEGPAFQRLLKPTWGEYTYTSNPSKLLARLKRVEAIATFILQHIKSLPPAIREGVQTILDEAKAKAA